MSRYLPEKIGVTLLVGTLAVLQSAPVVGQTALQRPAALKRFDRWVGNWSGSGWSLDRTGKRIDFNLAESVAPKAGGTVLVVEGHGTAKGDSGFTTHDGLVLVYYDEHSSRYRWNGHEVTSGSVDADITPIDDGLQWSIPAGPAGGSVRFTIRFDHERWREWGEASANGTDWTRFMEIDLGRVRGD